MFMVESTVFFTLFMVPMSLPSGNVKHSYRRGPPVEHAGFTVALEISG